MVETFLLRFNIRLVNIWFGLITPLHLSPDGIKIGFGDVSKRVSKYFIYVPAWFDTAFFEVQKKYCFHSFFRKGVWASPHYVVPKSLLKVL
jgi:hypothetical protein